MKSVETKVGLNSTPPQSSELLSKIKQHTPEHPALNRMRSKVFQSQGVQQITAYDRMHHRHNRS